MSMDTGEDGDILALLGLKPGQHRAFLCKDELAADMHLIRTWLAEEGIEPPPFPTPTGPGNRVQCPKPKWWNNEKERNARFNRFSWKGTGTEKLRWDQHASQIGFTQHFDTNEGVLGILALYEFAYHSGFVSFMVVAAHIAPNGSYHIHGTMEFTQQQRVDKLFKYMHRSQVGLRTFDRLAYLGYIGEPCGTEHLWPYEKTSHCHCSLGGECHLLKGHRWDWCKCEMRRNISERLRAEHGSVETYMKKQGRLGEFLHKLKAPFTGIKPLLCPGEATGSTAKSSLSTRRFSRD